MNKVYVFASKARRIVSLVTLVGCYLAFILMLILDFNVIALLLGSLLLGVFTYLILVFNRRKLVINGNCLTVVEFCTKRINAKEIKTIECDSRGLIEIKTKNEVVRCCGYTSGRSYDYFKNLKVTEDLKEWLKKYRKNRFNV